MSRVWPDVTIEEVGLRVLIVNLRKSLGNGKEPFFKGWQKLTNETTTPEVIRSWERINGHANTGLLCGDLLALDLNI